jgi:hypothetical protein
MESFAVLSLKKLINIAINTEIIVKMICFLKKKSSALAPILLATKIPTENIVNNPKKLSSKKISRIFLSTTNHQLLNKFFLPLLNNFLVF